MKIAVFGAGAIGGFLGARLARAGEDVALVARGAHLEAMQQKGVRVIEDGEDYVVHPFSTDRAREIGPCDCVVITLKAYAVPEALDDIETLLGPSTAVVWAVNGVPWWYFHRLEGPWQDRRIHCLDPDGRLWDRLGPERVIGCVVYPASEVVEPGVIRHIEGDRFTLGEPSGERTERVRRIARAFIRGGLRAPVRRIRDEIWAKLLGNLSFNPISALTLAPLDLIAGNPEVAAVARAMMVEARSVAEALGARVAVDPEQRIAGALSVGPHRTSMLQDLERGRPLETDALLGAVAELGELTAVPTPTIRIVLALLRLRAAAGPA